MNTDMVHEKKKGVQGAINVLTVGDGDLSFSLALKRSYPGISVTASTLLSLEELLQTYSNASATVQELSDQWGEKALYNVDCCKFHPKDFKEVTGRSGGKFDIIMFNHPHLGDSTLYESESHHAMRHHALLSHYFNSGQMLLSDGGRMHVTLCGSQPKTWNLMEAAKRNGFQCILSEGTASPLKWLFATRNSKDILNFSVDINGNFPEKDLILHCDSTIPEPAEVQDHYPCPRRYRNGKLGSKHFLGKYGYMHRRTGGDLYGGVAADMAVHQSVNFVFELRRKEEESFNSPSSFTRDNECKICGETFSSIVALQKHLEAPALPDINTGKFLHAKLKLPSKTDEQKGQMAEGQRSKEKATVSTFHQESISKAVMTKDELKIAETSVRKRFDLKRLKWLCRQEDFALSKHFKSKKHCTDSIKNGRICINGVVALDSGRILRENDLVSLLQECKSGPSLTSMSDRNDTTIKNRGVEVVRIVPITSNEKVKIFVCKKPVGIRTCGQFSERTLEMILKSIVEQRDQQSLHCESITKLEQGCTGLCVLTVGAASKVDISMKITYTFTTLVHGSVPEEWDRGIYVKLDNEGSRRWKRRKTKPCESNAGNFEKHDEGDRAFRMCAEGDLKNSLFFRCVDRYQEGVGTKTINISTVEVQSRHDEGRLSNVICYTLRKIGFPVVNDRFCKRELAGLPRLMRNILKNKLCIGCYSVHIISNVGNTDILPFDNVVSIKPHHRTQCSYWKGLARKS